MQTTEPGAPQRLDPYSVREFDVAGGGCQAHSVRGMFKHTCRLT